VVSNIRLETTVFIWTEWVINEPTTNLL
jgi:hypothetical protein